MIKKYTIIFWDNHKEIFYSDNDDCPDVITLLYNLDHCKIKSFSVEID